MSNLERHSLLKQKGTNVRAFLPE